MPVLSLIVSRRGTTYSVHCSTCSTYYTPPLVAMPLLSVQFKVMLLAWVLLSQHAPSTMCPSMSCITYLKKRKKKRLLGNKTVGGTEIFSSFNKPSLERKTVSIRGMTFCDERYVLQKNETMRSTLMSSMTLFQIKKNQFIFVIFRHQSFCTLSF